MRQWGDSHGYDGYGDEELKKGWKDFCGRWEATRATRNERRSLVTADVDVDTRRLTPDAAEQGKRPLFGLPCRVWSW